MVTRNLVAVTADELRQSGVRVKPVVWCVMTAREALAALETL